MNWFNFFLKSKNKNNNTDYGLKHNEPKEEEILNLKIPLLKKFENKKLSLKNINKKKLKISHLNLKKKILIINNFINLVNQNSNYKINMIKDSLSILLESNRKKIYLISFYSEFSDKEHIRPFNIFFIYIDNKNTKEINLIDKIAYIDILGSKSFSDISYGSDYKLFEGKLINIFKKKPLKLLLNQTKIDNYLNKKEYISKDSYERGFPKKKFNTIEPIYQYPKKSFKIKIGEKCLSDINNKIIITDCDNSKKYNLTKNNKIINNNKDCFTYHNDKDITFTPCNTELNCKKNNLINNCKIIKFRKYGGLEINKLNKCLDDDLTLKECNESKKIFLL